MATEVKPVQYRLASPGILGGERELGVGKLGWHGNFDTRFKINIVLNPVCVFFELFWNSECVLVYVRCARVWLFKISSRHQKR